MKQTCQSLSSHAHYSDGGGVSFSVGSNDDEEAVSILQEY